MLLCHWAKETGGWERPRIVPFGDIPVSPGQSALQYATGVCLSICVALSGDKASHWAKETGWERPRILPFGDIRVSPGQSALQYATGVCLSISTALCGDKARAH